VIGSLDGRIAHKAPPQLLLEVGGVGYEIEAPMSTFYGMPPVGERLKLLTHLVIREDAHVLFGFATAEERGLFRNLLKVSGVGPRIALAILSGVSVAGFAQCVREENTSALTRIPGVGRKTAERLIIEMRDRLADAMAAVASAATGGTSAGAAGTAGAAPARSDPSHDAWSALVALGYKPAEATRLMKQAGEGSTEDRIRMALQNAGREA
jgi:Holliday junction DNA helicase RuvA